MPLLKPHKPAHGELLKALIPDSPDINEVRDLIARGANVNETDDAGNTPLILAAVRDADITALLLERGAVVNVATKTGVTPFFMAVMSAATTQKSSGAMQLLLDAGADINAAVEAGVTPLMLCVSLDNSNLVRWLIERGADTTLEKPDGTTARMMGSPDVCKIVDSAEEIRTNFLDAVQREATSSRQAALKKAAPKFKL